MSAALYYFSGTGNSLHVARGLGERLPGSSLRPMVRLLDREAVTADAEVVGLIFPVHALTIPIVVKRFVQKLELGRAEYVFAVATRGGTVFRGFEKLDRLLARKGRRLDAHFLLNMGMNDPREAGFTCPDSVQISHLAEAVEQRLGAIQEVVANRRVSREPDTEYFIGLSPGLGGYLTERLAITGMSVAEYVGGVNYHYADDTCTGCGICEKVCLSGKITMSGQRPLWQKDVLCYMCYACVNFCPRRALQIKSIPGVPSHTSENPRYSHPFATVRDIAVQKRGVAGD